MKTKTINIYSFNELSDEAKEKALSEYREVKESWDSFDIDFLREDFKEELLKIGILIENFYFDIYKNEFYFSNPQIVYPILFLEKMGFTKWLMVKELSFKSEEEREEFKELLEDNFFITDNEMNYIESNGEAFEEEINEKFKDIRMKFLKQVREDYEYQMSDEALTEEIEANEYEFLNDGGRA